jgi:hypothetical protein
LKRWFTASDEHQQFCKWHLESTELIEKIHKRLIIQGKAPNMTSNQPRLEMARHRHSALDDFGRFERQMQHHQQLQDPSSQEEREW